MKRFYKAVSVSETGGGFIVTLDGASVTSLEGLPDDYKSDNVTETEEGDVP